MGKLSIFGSLIVLLAFLPGGSSVIPEPRHLTFGYRLYSSTFGDSVAIVFVVSATNLGMNPVEFCGEFQFRCEFKDVPYSSGGERGCPVFSVLDRKKTLLLPDEVVRLAPWEALSDTLKFRYKPGYFEPCEGEIELEAEFIYGLPRMGISMAERMDKGHLRVSIPIKKGAI
jgi:hypothetical protein